MKLTFLGANRQVTGSRYCLEAGSSRIMIDCGLFQERAYLGRNWESCPIPAAEFDAVLLTHVHVDHCGLLPKFVREGFSGRIYTTRPSAELAEVVLRDAAQIQMEDAAFKQKRHRKEGRTGKYPEIPLYTDADVERTLPRLNPVPYKDPVRVNDVFSVAFHDAGHILGSAMLEVLVRENGTERSVLFSGDIGQWDRPLVRDPTLFEQADYVVVESTYGDRDHEAAGRHRDELAGRDQRHGLPRRLGRHPHVCRRAGAGADVLHQPAGLRRPDSEYPGLPGQPDGGGRHGDISAVPRLPGCRHLAADRVGAAALAVSGAEDGADAEDSKAINHGKMPSLIMATSGMCNAGRIKHHLKHRIGNPHDTILFVGYQAQGTLGRQILEGNPEVRIHGRMLRVRAQIKQLHGLSGHADRRGLSRWLEHFRTPPRRLFVTHGEESGSLAFAEDIRTRLRWNVHVPEYQESVMLE